MLSQHFFFITERITDMLKLEGQKRKRKIRMPKSLNELHQVLSRVVDYLRIVEQGRDEQQRDLHQLYLELRLIADESDDVLNQIYYDGIYKADVINNLVDRIRNFHLNLPSGPTYNLHTGENNNYSGQQRIGPINISIDQAESSQITRVTRPKTHGEYPDSDLVGFGREIQTLVDHLTQDNETRVVVGIVGMGGIGKTTLAKHIYHHPKCNKKFIKKVWVCISQSWDKSRILKEISNQVIPRATQMEYDELIRSLSEQLRRQSYLLVLDDMWSIDAWNHICQAFPSWSNGSKVVVTSRNIAVPQSFDGTVHIVEPKPLDVKQSWELFNKKVLLPKNISNMQLKLGEEMVKKCEGLPLAVVALAGVLKMGRAIGYWERVSKTLRPKILQMNNESTQGFVNQVLELSYDELPHHLKQCVLYLRLFPEDYEIDARKLVKMWIAEGLIRTNEEYTAEEYLDEIVQRYIVKVVKINFIEQVVLIRIHDLFRQMLVDVDQKRDFLKDPCRYSYEQINTTFCKLQSKSKSIANVERTTSQVHSIFIPRLFLEKNNILQWWFGKFRLLRVLILHIILEHDHQAMMLDEIGNMIHLRYLELGGTVDHVESIENLRNLWTLDVRRISHVGIIPMDFNLCKLKELRHLYLPDMLPWQLNLKWGRLKKLKTLWNVHGGDWLLSMMPVLSADLLELNIFITMDDSEGSNKGSSDVLITMDDSEESSAENSEETSEESSAGKLEMVFRIPSLKNLEILELRWNGYILDDMIILSECKSLKKLSLNGPIKVDTPIVFPVNLIELELWGTCLKDREVMNIISESCPCLKALRFCERAYMGSELVCNTNSFLQLETLLLRHLENLRLWIIKTSAMPSLHQLIVANISDLDLNAEGWPFITNIPRLTYIGYEDDLFAKKLRVFRKDDHNLSQSTNYHYRGRRGRKRREK